MVTLKLKVEEVVSQREEGKEKKLCHPIVESLNWRSI